MADDVLRFTLTVIHVGEGVWCPHCLRSSAVCLRGTMGDRWFTRRLCPDCGHDIKE